MFLIDRRYFKYFDWTSFFIIMLLSLIGLLFVFSATYKPELPVSVFFKKQLIGVFIGFIIYFLCSTAHHQSLMRWGYFCYFAIMAMLIFTLIKGHIGMGGQRWIDVGLFKVQPSELAKVFFPAFAVHYFFTQKDSLNFAFADYVPAIGILAISTLLIRKQPDLGTALLVLFSGLIILWLFGLNKKFFIYGLLLVLVTAPVTWHFLKPYQKKRIAVFLGEGDNLKDRYQIEQSLIAVGSGGFYGKGFLNGTQNKLQFLPEGRTDFIFSVIAEEWGFLGTFTVLFLFALLFIRFYLVTTTIKDPVIQILALGLVTHILLSVIVNICMVLGMLPVVGIPLPLISYGLSNLWTTFASLGWFNSIAIRRFY